MNTTTMSHSVFEIFPGLVDRGICKFENLGINYWAIPKNASTTLKIHFSQLNHVGKVEWNEEEYSRQNPQARLNMENAASEHIQYITENEAIHNGLKNCIFIRHPFRRMLTTYSFMFQNNWFKRKSAFKNLFTEGMSFENFLLTIYDKKLYVNYDTIFVPQTAFLPKDHLLDVFVDIDHLTKKWPFKFPSPTIHVNKSNSYQYKDQMTEDAKALIYAMHSSDFSDLGQYIEPLTI